MNIKEFSKTIFILLLLGVFSQSFANFDHSPETKHLIDVGIISSSHTNPTSLQQKVTRAQALTIALRAGSIRIPETFDGNTFYEDVDPNLWYAPIVGRAVKTKILRNRYSTHFRPEDFVTKAEFLALLFRATIVDLRPFFLERNIAEDISEEDWSRFLFAYAKKYQIAEISDDGFYYPQNTLTLQEIINITYKQLRLFHGGPDTKIIVELEASLKQFLKFIKNGETQKAEMFVHKILKLNDKLLRTKNTKDAVATLAISKAMEYLSESLRYFHHGKTLSAIEKLHLATKQIQKAEQKSESVAPFTQELSKLIEKTLQSFIQ